MIEVQHVPAPPWQRYEKPEPPPAPEPAPEPEPTKVP
jgi:hypothetical protein